MFSLFGVTLFETTCWRFSISDHTILKAFLWKNKFFIFVFLGFSSGFQLNGTLNKGKRSLDRISVDRNCVLSVDQNCGNHLIKFFDTFHLIESLNNEFGQTPKNLSLDRIIRSTAKIHQFLFGSWSNLFLSLKYHY